MPALRKEKKEIKKFVFPVYSNLELSTFEKELDAKYKITKTLSTGEVISYYDESKYYKDNGGLGELGGVIMGGIPIKYEVLRDKVLQLYKYQKRKDWAKKQETIHLEKLVETMEVEELSNYKEEFIPF